MIDLVLDTNVLVSGIFFSGPPSKIIEKIIENKLHIILSEEIIDEYTEVIMRYLGKRGLSTDVPLQILHSIISLSTIIDATFIAAPFCEDPDDIIFLQTAMASKAQYLVSGDKHLLKIKTYHGGIILKAKNFLDLI